MPYRTILVYLNARKAVQIVALVLAINATTVIAQSALPQQRSDLMRCDTIVSIERRLQMERWARPDECNRPTRARVTDFFLGYTCISEAGIDSCRSFVPKPGSRDLDTAKGFRCLDMSFTIVGAGAFNVNRLREWATTSNECEWDPNLGLLATEIDFDNGQICAAGACMSVQHLTGIGKARLKYLVISAFRDSGVTSAPNLAPQTAASSVAPRVLFTRRPSR